MMEQQMQFAAIPQPKPDPLLKNLKDLDKENPVQSMMRLARIYGPIYRLSLLSRDMLIVTSQELVNELCNEERFDKKVHAPLENIRAAAGDGLFTAHTQEPNWAKAHRILMPAFGPASIRDMFDPMLDIANQLLLRWERFGENAVIDVPDNMTRLTLDTIALCAFDTRFNSFYQNEMHPFVNAMVESLRESGMRGRRLPVQNHLMMLTNHRYEENNRYMHKVADELIAQRKNDPAGSEKRDLLNRMLQGRDPVTGEGLSDENIRYQLVTFLIAGHETTSGLLSFALYELLKNPHVLQRARAQVDEVLGQEMPRFEHLAQLTYIDQVLKETLRIWPTAPAIGIQAYEDTVLGGKYPFKKGETAMVILPMLHRDPRVWDDPEKFDPDRFAPEAYAKLPPDAWKPFGNGQRSCIGRPFALQEAQLVLSMILQRFDLIEHNPSYQLKIKETLTLKPTDFYIRARCRGTTNFATSSVTVTTPARPLNHAAPAEPQAKGTLTPMLVLFGSNSGSSEAFAQRISSDARAQGYAAEVSALDNHVGHLPKEGAVVIVTASYEGQPPDNAKQFVAWLDHLKPGDLAGVKFAVFGCGNSDWVRTFQAVPKKIDDGLAAAGATRIKERGAADAHGDFFGDFDRWYDTLWSTLAETFGHEVQANTVGSLYNVEEVPQSRSAILRQNELQQGEIVESRELVNMSSPMGRSKRHIEIALPEGMSYRAGDYLAILPTNPRQNVIRALNRFGFAPDKQIILHKANTSQTSLPTGYPISVNEILTSYVELAQPVTRKHVELLANATHDPAEKAALEQLMQDEIYQRNVLQKRVSVLDLLEQFPSCSLPFGTFLEMLPPMHARQYSISSSPLWNETHCTLTVAVVDGPALSGHGTYLGAASNYLAEAYPGSKVSVAVRPSNVAFHLPQNPETPIIMVCAGSGLAPFRGFIQERSIQASHGQKLGEALLFFGCDHPEVDYLYRDELEAWEKAGVVKLRPTFTFAPDGDVQFVQHRLWHERAEVIALFRQGARIFVCGDGRRMAPAVRETFVRIYQDATQSSLEVAEAWANEIERTSTRYVADVFA